MRIRGLLPDALSSSVDWPHALTTLARAWLLSFSPSARPIFDAHSRSSERAVMGRATLLCVLSVCGLWGAPSMSNLSAQSTVVVRLDAEPETDWSKPSFWETLDGQPAELSWDFRDGLICLAHREAPWEVS